MRRLMLLALVAGLAGCGGSSEPESSPEPPTGPESGTTQEQAQTGDQATTEAAPREPKPPPGAPRFVAGYRDWRKLNREPIPPRASDPHNGTKNVFASSGRRANGRFPSGTIVVKEATRPGADFISLIAIMRKVGGADPAHHDWVFSEYTREGGDDRFALQAEGTVCWSCHMGALDRDYVFTP